MTQQDATPAPTSWEQVVREHSDQVYRLAYRLTGNRADAEDLTQDVFIRVFNRLSDYQPGTFAGWLHRITTNLFLDQARRRRRLRFDGLGARTEVLAADVEFSSPERRFEHENLGADVQAALDGLKPQYRAAVVLSDMEGLTYEEISRVLNISMGTVRSRIHRGRAALRQALAHRQKQSRDVDIPITPAQAAP